MFELPIIDKLINLKSMIFSSTIFIILFLVFISFFIIMLILKKRKKIFFLLSFCLIIIILIFMAYNKFNIFIDYFVDVIFSFIYYPNFTVYCIIIFTINIIMFYLLNKNNLLYKITIFIYYSIMFIFILNIKIIDKENIDIHSKVSIFGNNYLLSFIEISTFLFTIYVLFCFIRFMVYKLLNIKTNIKLKKITVDKQKEEYFSDKLNIDTIRLDEINTTELKKTNELFLSTFNNII